MFPQSAIVRAISAKPSGTSLFVLGFDGRVWSTYFEPGADWVDWFPITGQSFYFEHSISS